MTDLERRVVRLERRLRVWQVAAVVAVGIACKQAVPPPAPQAPPPAPPTQLDFASSDGHSVHIDANGIEVRDHGDSMKLQPTLLDMKSGKAEIQLWIQERVARVIANYDQLSRSATLAAGEYYGQVSSTFLPEDGSGSRAYGQLGADKDGASLDFTHGDAKKTYK